MSTGASRLNRMAKSMGLKPKKMRQLARDFPDMSEAQLAAYVEEERMVNKSTVPAQCVPPYRNVGEPGGPEVYVRR